MNAGNIEIASLSLPGGLNIGWYPLIMFIVSVLTIGILQFIFYKTSLGRAFRATSDDQEIAQLMGLNKNHIFGLAMAISMVVVAIAGTFLGVRTSFDPAAGPGRLIFGFEAVNFSNEIVTPTVSGFEGSVHFGRSGSETLAGDEGADLFQLKILHP